MLLDMQWKQACAYGPVGDVEGLHWKEEFGKEYVDPSLRDDLWTPYPFSGTRGEEDEELDGDQYEPPTVTSSPRGPAGRQEDSSSDSEEEENGKDEGDEDEDDGENGEEDVEKKGGDEEEEEGEKTTSSSLEESPTSSATSSTRMLNTKGKQSDLEMAVLVDHKTKKKQSKSKKKKTAKRKDSKAWASKRPEEQDGGAPFDDVLV